jgi:hypothetical protein
MQGQLSRACRNTTAVDNKLYGVSERGGPWSRQGKQNSDGEQEQAAQEQGKTVRWVYVLLWGREREREGDTGMRAVIAHEPFWWGTERPSALMQAQVL